MFGPVSSSAGAAWVALPGEPRVMSEGMAEVAAVLCASAGCHMLTAANSEAAAENSGMHVGPSVVCAKRANAARTSSVLTARLMPSHTCTRYASILLRALICISYIQAYIPARAPCGCGAAAAVPPPLTGVTCVRDHRLRCRCTASAAGPRSFVI